MKTKAVIIAVAALSVFVSRRSFAEWGISTVSKEEIKKLGAEFRAMAAGPEDVRVEFQINTAGELKGFSRIDLRIGGNGNSDVTAALKEDRSKPGRAHRQLFR